MNGSLLAPSASLGQKGWQSEYNGDCLTCADLIEQYEQDAYFEALDMQVHHQEVYSGA